MAQNDILTSFGDLPPHLILDVLISGHLSPIDLVNIELTSKVFGWGLHSPYYKSLADQAASRLCNMHPIFVALSLNNRRKLLARCAGNWKRVLRFLKSINESSDMVETSGGKIQVTTRANVTMVINNSKVYSCGSHEFGGLAQGPEIKNCLGLTPVAFQFPAQVIQASTGEFNSAFVMLSGEVFTCGENRYFSCGHSDTDLPIYKPRLVEYLKNTPCKQVATGNNFTVFLSRDGHVYTVGGNEYGQLGHGDTLDSQVPKTVQVLNNVGPVVQVSAGAFYVLAVTEDGSVYSFGDDSDRCLGHGDFEHKLQPHAIHTFQREGVHILRVCAGSRHAIAIDSNGYVYTWGKNSAGCLGHGDQRHESTPKVLISLKNHLAVQVCAGWLKTFVVSEDGLVYGFGLLNFGTLGFQGGQDEEVDQPRVIECLRSHRVLQVCDGMSHSLVVTQDGQLLGLGDNTCFLLSHTYLDAA